MFDGDYREEIIPDLEAIPPFKKYPSTFKELDELQKRLDPNIKKRFPKNFNKKIKQWQIRDYPLILRVHRGFFLSMGVYDNQRFLEVLELIMENPEFVKKYMDIQGQFAAAISEEIIKRIKVDAIFFSEPIGSNVSTLISPQMYEEFVLESYLPILKVCNKYNINTKIFLTYANISKLIPSIIKYGINCLWACEVDSNEMDYLNLRKQYGNQLSLIGGIDLDKLLLDKNSIKNEIIKKVPLLVEQGGYIPLADGRVRPNVPFENYTYYRNLIKEVTQQ